MNKYVCYASWGNDLPTLALDGGWKRVTLHNLGMSMSGPKDLPRPQVDTCIFDWEPPIPDLRKWTKLLRTAKPGDIAYGLDPGVNNPRYDKPVGLLANVLRPYGISMAYDFYLHPEDTDESYDYRAMYRSDRLRFIRELSGMQTVQVFSPQNLYAKDPYGSPEIFDPAVLQVMASYVDLSMDILIFVGTSNASARVEVDDAVLKFSSIFN